jgi:hypothetical protein
MCRAGFSGKCAVSTRCCRDCTTTCGRPGWWCGRRWRGYPSSFGSNAEQAPTGRLVTAFAVIGATGGRSAGSGSSLTAGR